MSLKSLKWVKLDTQYPSAGKFVQVRDRSGNETGGVWIDELVYGDLTFKNYWHLVGSVSGEVYEWALVEAPDMTQSGIKTFRSSDRTSHMVPKH